MGEPLMVMPISGFLPVPLPMMIPFMGAQSLVIGKMFGEGFQYGKRKISAMPNEEFNKLTFEKLMSNAREEIKASVPTMNAAMQDMQPMVEVVVREFFNYISLVTKLVTGTGEGKNIFEEEGHDIGDWIKEQLGIPHTPHGGSVSIPIDTGKGGGRGGGRGGSSVKVEEKDEFVTPTPIDETNVKKLVKMVLQDINTGVKKNKSIMMTEFELAQLIINTNKVILVTTHPLKISGYKHNLKQYKSAMLKVFGKKL